MQAPAGTGKSYVLKALCLWCLLNKKAYRAAAPTGIAAANLELPGTGAAATTIHNLFELDAELKTKMDFSKSGCEKVKEFLGLQALFIDEGSMIDDEWWCCLAATLSRADGAKRLRQEQAARFRRSRE